MRSLKKYDHNFTLALQVGSILTIPSAQRFQNLHTTIF